MAESRITDITIAARNGRLFCCAWWRTWTSILSSTSSRETRYTMTCKKHCTRHRTRMRESGTYCRWVMKIQNWIFNKKPPLVSRGLAWSWRVRQHAIYTKRQGFFTYKSYHITMYLSMGWGAKIHTNLGNVLSIYRCMVSASNAHVIENENTLITRIQYTWWKYERLQCAVLKTRYNHMHQRFKGR